MMSIVIDYIKSHNFQKAADLYCGVGTFSIAASRYLKKVIAIENTVSAINDAQCNAKTNNCNNITFINKDVESTLNLIKEYNCELIILDPPRSGLNNKKIIDCIAKIAKAIIYIACDPSKQARDIKLLLEKGFFLKKVMLIDMFPQTHHIESICILEKTYA
jgi:23S rRNA (uracil1939-C5)-methyltransferase